jgi:hypothetical protein
VRKYFKQNKCGGMASAFLLASLVLFLSLAGASTALHQIIHPDATAPGHSCVITLFAEGQVDAASAVPVLAVFILVFARVTLLPDTFLLPSADYRYSASRAPPAFAALPV